MKTRCVHLLVATGLILLVQQVPSEAANVLVDFSASYNDPTTPPFPFTNNNDPAAVTQATGPLSPDASPPESQITNLPVL